MNNLIIVRGGGDLASGTVHKLYRCGYRVLILETHRPSAIRRNVAFCEAVYRKTQTVEGVTCHLADCAASAMALLEAGKLTLLVDPDCSCIPLLQPLAVVDGILAKKNLGTSRQMAPITIALGPGFEAGRDVDAVIETLRGHDLGRVILQGRAAPDTGIPGMVAGYAEQRVLRAGADGTWVPLRSITDTVTRGETVGYIQTPSGDVPLTASMDGLLRGILPEGYPVTRGFKTADIDPRPDQIRNCFTISDKARCIAGGVLEALLYLKGERGL